MRRASPWCLNGLDSSAHAIASLGSLERTARGNLEKTIRRVPSVGRRGGDRCQAYVETDKNGVRTVLVNMDHPMWNVEASMTPTKLRYCIRQILERSIAEDILPASPATPEEAYSVLEVLYNDALA